MQYRELQAALKNLRNAGYDVQVKLNTSYEILQAEYDRLTAIAVEPAPEITADQFNTWVGLPTEAIATQDKPEQPTLAQSKAEPKPRLNIGNLRQNEGSTERQNSEVLVEQGFEFIQANIGSCISMNQQPREYPGKQPQHNPEVLPHKKINIQPKVSYWIDRSALGQKLDPTQVQALRNAEDGVRWLKKWTRNIQAFAEGFAEGRPTIQPKRSPQVIALDRYRYPQVA